jgi:hypothetical protein
MYYSSKSFASQADGTQPVQAGGTQSVGSLKELMVRHDLPHFQHDKTKSRVVVRNVADLRRYVTFVNFLMDKYAGMNGLKRTIGELLSISPNRIGEWQRLWAACSDPDSPFAEMEQIRNALKEPTLSLSHLTALLRQLGWDTLNSNCGKRRRSKISKTTTTTSKVGTGSKSCNDSSSNSSNGTNRSIPCDEDRQIRITVYPDPSGLSHKREQQQQQQQQEQQQQPTTTATTTTTTTPRNRQYNHHYNLHYAHNKQELEDTFRLPPLNTLATVAASSPPSPILDEETYNRAPFSVLDYPAAAVHPPLVKLETATLNWETLKRQHHHHHQQQQQQRQQQQEHWQWQSRLVDGGYISPNTTTSSASGTFASYEPLSPWSLNSPIPPPLHLELLTPLSIGSPHTSHSPRTSPVSESARQAAISMHFR